MFRFSRIVVVLAVGAIVGVAFAKAIKVKAFDWVHEENPDGDGIAIANFHEGNNQTEITAAITDFLPDTDYMIAVRPGLDGAPVTTNAAGNANAHASPNFDICGFPGDVCFIVWRDLDGDTFRAPNGSENRAVGCVPCP